jgi:hypothetical protein
MLLEDIEESGAALVGWRRRVLMVCMDLRSYEHIGFAYYIMHTYSGHR